MLRLKDVWITSGFRPNAVVEASLDQKIGARFTAFEKEMSRNVRWLVGLQVTTLLAMIAAVLGR